MLFPNWGMNLWKKMKETETWIDGWLWQISTGFFKETTSVRFKPLAFVVNLSTCLSTITNGWETDIPLHKWGPLEYSHNYWPISILPVTSKVFEKAMHEQLLKWKKQNIKKKTNWIQKETLNWFDNIISCRWDNLTNW